MVAILLITTIHAWFFAIILWKFKKQKDLSDFVLIIWFIFIGLHSSSFLFIHYRDVNLLSIAFPFLQGPFLYLYLLSKVKKPVRLSNRHVLHVLPFLIFVGYQYYQVLSNPLLANEHQHYVNFITISNPFGILFVVQLAVYLFLSYQLSRRNNHHSVWLKTLVFSIMIIWLSSTSSMFFPNVNDHAIQMKFDVFIFVVLTIFVYLASYLGLKENILPVAKKASKYEKNVLSNVESEKIWTDLQKLMEEEQLFIKADLSLNKLSDQIDTSLNKLSQVINQQSHQTFNDYINSYRVNHAKEMIRNPSNLTLLAIAYASGFSSKSTFNRAFKKATGITPSEYLKKEVSSHRMTRNEVI
ncbi:MAG: AraC family transcriptional regulator [Cyclobacteriaceae bacterium]